MATSSALKFNPSVESPVIKVRSRNAAFRGMLEDPDTVTIHEQVLSEMTYKVVSEFIRLDDQGQKIDIKMQGPVYEVLEYVENELTEAGAGHFAVGQILDELTSYVSGLGAHFAIQAKAKPLYARVIVTDKKPDDLPDCAFQSVTLIDGHRKQGDGAGQMSMTLTVNGTSNAMSRGMDVQHMIESSKQKWLMIFYGTIDGADLSKFDTVDANCAELIVAAGGASMKEIRAAIEQGTLPPQVQEFIATIAELKSVIEAARTPGGLESPSATIDALKTAIIEISAALRETPALLEALPQETQQAITDMQTDILSAISQENTIGQQIVKLETEHRNELNFLIERSDLPEIEREKYLAEVKSGQANIETLQQIVSRIAEISPALNISYVREHLTALTAQAAAAVNKPAPLEIDPIIRDQVISAVVQLPISPIAIQQLMQGTTSKATVANVIVAAGGQPSREVSHYIREGVQQIIRREAAPVVNYLRGNPLPHVSAAVVAKLDSGQKISAAEIQSITTNPTTPRSVAKALEQVSAVQKQTTAHLSPARIKKELAKVEEVLRKTDPKLAEIVRKFVASNPNITTKALIPWVEAMPSNVRDSLNRAMDKASRHENPPFRPHNAPEFVRFLQDSAVRLPEHEREPFRKMEEKARLGEPITREELNEVAKKLPVESHSTLSDSLVKIENEESGIKDACDGNCKNCKNYNVCHGLPFAAADKLDAELSVSPPTNKPIGYGGLIPNSLGL